MNTQGFVFRHVGPNENEEALMLSEINASSVDELVAQTLPEAIRLKQPISLPAAISEHAFSKHISALGKRNKVFSSFIGLGYHEAILPGVIQRNILENPGWYTAYTPYQAEIAQGRMEALLNFQTMVTDLTGMELANASLLDESTAAAEAMSLLFGQRTRAQKKSNTSLFFVDENTLPQTKSVLETRATPIGITLIYGTPKNFVPSNEYFGALVQYPGSNGAIPDLKSFIEAASEAEIKTAVAADLMSLILLEAPGTLGADVVVGSTQRFGIPLGYGGPHAAYFATKTDYKRSIPGRIIGVTQDKSGNRALRMALQTREQHIKRDRATSNICTAQVLLAVMAGMYAVYHGPKGLREIASRIHQNACTLNTALSSLGIRQKNKAFFDTLWIEAPEKKIRPLAEKADINLRYINENELTLSVNEATDSKQIETLIEIFAEATNSDITKITFTDSCIPDSYKRSTTFLSHDVFHRYHAETSMMRYIKSLERKDLALNHSMIALGSCTMKLNAATEMFALSDPQWNNIHPFAPLNQVEGYTHMLHDLADYLTEITGFGGTSLQPNSGAQGEFAGLMVIRAYHQANNNTNRNICLIPASAHGTNPASAVMAGMHVVVVGTDERGNIDLDDLKQKADTHAENLAALMITYPSTHGVFESAIKEITAYIHSKGGQIYMDGANMNAQVGLTNPAAIGADVCHLNLHKTFAIPHGGGGPGVGPICVAEHLVPFLPSHVIVPTSGKQGISALSAAPFGSALACLISYAYIRLLGADGLKKSTEIAILNANYIKERIAKHYPVLYSGDNNRAAHEFIIDCRAFKEKGVEVMDIAKRLIDYGFHAPTVSFPVAGTMMIEPTESENKEELDRFCEALISIRYEIEASDANQENNMLRNAPHTLAQLTAHEWELPYTRDEAAYPLQYVRENKFWASVQRVDEAFGDRNLVCTCAPIESYSNKEVAQTNNQ
ncbi:MAG: aminomethyl-transferring glycine dehydrogenase [Bacteroidetes bacterium]|nr:aminomethyl-transferring glycine dehydrogenase [Bacteroidota bacterium]MDA0888412.1 aminomethyl-transferring glycine dehydrogenase [Bacteroidota bacterium]MDA1084472.1 aminomethyl-transferring glycine dehydrogenase [Bacteroidota bacterium]